MTESVEMAVVEYEVQGKTGHKTFEIPLVFFERIKEILREIESQEGTICVSEVIEQVDGEILKVISAAGDRIFVRAIKQFCVEAEQEQYRESGKKTKNKPKDLCVRLRHLL